jgi:hypothetical protein
MLRLTSVLEYSANGVGQRLYDIKPVNRAAAKFILNNSCLPRGLLGGRPENRQSDSNCSSTVLLNIADHVKWTAVTNWSHESGES